MRCQTIGFENIEWVIVVHNCKPHYLPLLTEMFKDDKNVVIKELNDGIRSPAPPRNHGLMFVTGPYVGFLDGDDSYTPDCLEVASREMAETQSQVVTFRREYELETESLHPHTEKVAWNQTEWRIVMDRGNFQMDKMFSGLWAFSTSRLYDAAFLRKHNLKFSENVLWMEDAWHTGMSLMKADRVCYLPQFIGYHYFINGGSIVQNTNKPMEELFDCFKSAGRIIDDLAAMGVDTNDTAQTLFAMLALNTRRVADMFDYMTAHRDELMVRLREADAKRADEVEDAFLSEQPLAKSLWPRLQRIVAFGAGECYDATARMKEFTGDTDGQNIIHDILVCSNPCQISRIVAVFEADERKGEKKDERKEQQCSVWCVVLGLMCLV